MGVDYEEMGKNERGRDGMAESIKKVGGREGLTWCHICP